MTYYTYVTSPIGRLLLAGDGVAIERLHFSSGSKAQLPDVAWVARPEVFTDAAHQLEAYFQGALQDFALTLNPQGTSFQLAVWRELVKIPYGRTVTYGELATRLGNPQASRAVGLANGANPIAIVQPCHRVIGANGKLTGFGGGLDVKQRLLDLERGEPRMF